jgi:urease accessory protein
MTPQQHLRLQQVFDSQFPIGAFAFSGGLETYSQLPDSAAARFDKEALAELLLHEIALGWGRLDLAAACLAWRHHGEPDALERLAREVEAFKVIPGQRWMSLRLGRRWMTLAKRLFPLPMARLPAMPRPHQSVVCGAIAAALELPEAESLLAFAQASLTASLSAATRAMALSPEQAHEIVIGLQPALIDAVERVRRDPEASLFAATPALDIRAHQQLFLHTRLFQS